MRANALMALSVCVGLCAGRVVAGAVADWTFNGGVAGATATTLVTQTNSPALDGVAAAANGGSAPTFSANVPGAVIYSRWCGEPICADNSASLHFVNASLPGTQCTMVGGTVEVPDSGSLLRVTNLTVEAFVKVDRREWYALIVGKSRSDGTSWNIDMTAAGQPRVRIDSSAIGNKDQGAGYNQNWGATTNIEDGKWHHVAFTYSWADRAVKLYVDYVLSAVGTSYSNLVYDAGGLYIGEGAGGQAFDGWIDEVRVSDKVLLPYQFMTLTAPSSSAAVGYWTFDGATDTAASEVANEVCSPALNGRAVAGGSGYPTYSAERPPATTARISDGDKGPQVNVNSGSLFFSAGSHVEIDGMAVTNFTAEAFVKVNQHGYDWPQLIGKARNETSGLSWSLAVNCYGNLRARFDTQVPPSSDGINTCFESSAAMVDGQWHHVALSYSDATHTVKLYKDYVKVLEGTTWASLKLDDGVYKIGAGDANFNGWIDEVRLTACVLEPSAFLHNVPIAGTSVRLK